MSDITFIANADIQQRLLDGLNANAQHAKGLPPIKSFSIGAYKNKTLISDITGYRYYGCCSIDSLWVELKHRKSGIGRNLLFQIENKAVIEGNLFVSIRTMDFEAKDFYVKFGYEILFIQEGFVNESKMYFLTKNL